MTITARKGVVACSHKVNENCSDARLDKFSFRYQQLKKPYNLNTPSSKVMKYASNECSEGKYRTAAAAFATKAAVSPADEPSITADFPAG